MAKEKDSKKVFDSSLIKRLFHFVRPYGLFFYTSLILAILMAFITPFRPYLIQLTVNKAVNPKLSIPDWLQHLLQLGQNHTVFQFIINITILSLIHISEPTRPY